MCIYNRIMIKGKDMFVSSLKLNRPKFCQNQSNVGLGNPQKAPSIIEEAAIEIPSISSVQLFVGILSDEQITQINKAKVLPQNACFYRTQDMEGLSRGPKKFVLLDEYTIQPNLPWFNPKTRVLPADYIVVKDKLGFAKAIKNENNV